MGTPSPIARRNGIAERIQWLRILVQPVALRDDGSAYFIVCFLVEREFD